MRDRRSAWRVVVGSVALLASALSTAQAEPDRQRMYLLRADSGFSYWSPDPAEPDANALEFSRRCMEYSGRMCGTASPTPLGFASLIPFLPGALADAPLTWSAEDPIRFRFAAVVDSDVPFTVSGLVFSTGIAVESPAAVEVAPGVWEGAIGGEGSIGPDRSLLFGIVVRQPGLARTRLQVDVKTAGASWFEIATDGDVTSMSKVRDMDTYAPDPSDYRSAERWLRFNDRDWEAFTFEGDFSRTADHVVELPRKAAIVMGWFESVSEPFVYGVTRGNTDARDPSEMGLVRLRSGTTLLSSGRYSASAVSVAPGAFTMSIEPQDGADHHPYRAHLIVVYGDRTLDSFRWRFEVPALHVRSPVLHAMAGPQQQVPSTPATAMFSVTFASSSGTPLPARWAIGWDVPGLYAPEAGLSGTTWPLHAVKQGVRLSRVTPVPATDSITVSAYDTIFEGEVRYTYRVAS